jgi:hypothetical protein
VPPRSAAERDIKDPGPIGRAYRTASLTRRGRRSAIGAEEGTRSDPSRSDAPRQGCEARDGMGKLGPRQARASLSARLFHPGPRSRRGRDSGLGPVLLFPAAMASQSRTSSPDPEDCQTHEDR